MRTAVVAASALVLGAGSLGSAALAQPAPAGAAHRFLVPTTDSNGSSNQCAPTSANVNTRYGFAVVNAPGKPDAAFKVNGEVSLKNAAPDSPYSVYLATDSSHCRLEGLIVTNPHGNGNAHLNDPTLGSGTYYVVLRDAGGNEQFATTPATVR